MLRIEFVEPTSFNLLSKDWKRLEQGDDMTAFQSLLWYKQINEQYLKKAYTIPGKAIYAIVYDDNEATMIAPIYIVHLPAIFSRIGVSSGAYILGKWGYSDYLNFIYLNFSIDCFNYIISSIKSKYNVNKIFMHQILPETDMHFNLNKFFHESFDFEGDCAKIIPSADFGGYYKGLSKSVRQNLRTAKNRAIRSGIDIKYKKMKLIDRKDAEEFFEIYKQRQYTKLSHEDKSIFSLIQNKLLTFLNKKAVYKYNFIVESMIYLENCIVLGFYSGEEKIGFCLAIDDNKALRIPIICFKEEYSWYSPGMICIYNYLKDSYDDGSIKTFDLLKGAEKYKLDLGATKFAIGYYNIITKRCKD